MVKTCKKCGVERPMTDFYRTRNTRDGYWNECRSCVALRRLRWTQENRQKVKQYQRKYMREYKTRPEVKQKRLAYDAAHPEKPHARNVLKGRIARGSIKRLPCEICGTNERVEAHHTDYAKPLEVRWLCLLHHKQEHRKAI